MDRKRIIDETLELAAHHANLAERMKRAAAILSGEAEGMIISPRPKKKRRLNKEAIERIRAAQKRRWAKVHRLQKAKRKMVGAS